MKRATILAAVLIAAPQLALSAQEEFHWSGKLATGKAVEIKGVNGAIRATGVPGGEVEVTAVKKGRKSDPDEVKVEDGHIVMPELPGIGFEGKSDLIEVMRALAD